MSRPTWVDTVADRLADLPPLRVLVEFGTVRVDVARADWRPAVEAAATRLGCRFFDWLTAVDELDDGFALVCHLAALPAGDDPLRRLLVRTSVPRDDPVVASVAGVFAGAAWHEREVREMFGVRFAGHGAAADGLLLPAGFEGHPLRKDFVLASRAAVGWPGAKEPGESDASLAARSAGDAPGRAGRRRSRPPGVPDPDTWGPRAPGSPAPDPLAPVTPTRRSGRGSDR